MKETHLPTHTSDVTTLWCYTDVFIVIIFFSTDQYDMSTSLLIDIIERDNQLSLIIRCRLVGCDRRRHGERPVSTC